MAVAPEEVAAMFARNPELAARPEYSDAASKVGAALSAKAEAHKAADKAGLASKAITRDSKGRVAPPPRPSLEQLQSSAASLSTARGRSGIVSKLILATILGLIALEVASLASGRYFNWNFGKAAQNLGSGAVGAANALGLAPPSSASTSAQSFVKQVQAAVHP